MYKAGVGDGLTVLKGIQRVQSWVLVVMIGLVLRASRVYKAGCWWMIGLVLRASSVYKAGGDDWTGLKGIQCVQSWMLVDDLTGLKLQLSLSFLLQ